MRSVLITRPEPDALRTAAQVKEAGCLPLVHPLMRIVPRREGPLDMSAVDALAFTSANGVRSYAALGGAPRPVFAVGDASADEARRYGLPVAGTAKGDVESLAALILEARPGSILHPSGAAAAGDLTGALVRKGVPCRRVVLYDAVAEEALPPGLAQAISTGPDWLLLYSPRSARLFTRLVKDAGLEDAIGSTCLGALSSSVAQATDLRFRRVQVASSSAGSALVDIIKPRDT